MNDELVKHYLSMPKKDLNFIPQNVKCDNLSLFNELNTNFEQWSYTIEKEENIEDDTAYYCSVTLYIPGIVMQGIARTEKDFHTDYKSVAIKKAILDALINSYVGISKCSSFTKEQVVRINRIKKERSITNDTEFLQLLKQWDKDIKSKKDLNASNIDDFIEWARN